MIIFISTITFKTWLFFHLILRGSLTPFLLSVDGFFTAFFFLFIRLPQFSVPLDLTFHFCIDLWQFTLPYSSGLLRFFLDMIHVLFDYVNQILPRVLYLNLCRAIWRTLFPSIIPFLHMYFPSAFFIHPCYGFTFMNLVLD